MTIWRVLNVLNIALIASLEVVKIQGASVGIPKEWLFLVSVITVGLTIVANQLPAILRDDSVAKAPSPLITPTKQS